jgi:hypothetical protein
MTAVASSNKTLSFSGTAFGSPVTGTGTWSKSGSTYTLICNMTFPGATQTCTLTGWNSPDLVDTPLRS